MLGLKDYEERVYAGLLGKVIGVYLGRPFESWNKDKIVATFGRIDRYVHEKCGVPLVVADDDISGTLTFVRALEDSGHYRATTARDFGRAWLNYLVENRTILWWGGAGVSTEHTAYLRLKQGIEAPDSGSASTNGKTVSEQIGAQIFIDGLGLVAPGDPGLAATLAREAASVSHDGEAIYGAIIVASMISAAFVESDMDKLLDIGLGLIPADSGIARVHRDVREWRQRDNDWNLTYNRIKEKYGYQNFLGNCHIIPNHALMVMAWAYAPDDFALSQEIVNTAGWDTDCNAANVGCVMGVKLGLDGINRSYDFQGPMADRIILPTADGTRHATDCLNEALHIARMGRKVMGWTESDPGDRPGPLHHFSLRGALHGYQAETSDINTAGTVELSNPRGEGMSIRLKELSKGRVGRISTPLLYDRSFPPHYAIQGTPLAYPGQRLVAELRCSEASNGARVRLFFRMRRGSACEYSLFYAEERSLTVGETMSLSISVPEIREGYCVDFGLEFKGVERGSAELVLRAVSIEGKPLFELPVPLPTDENRMPIGCIYDMDGYTDNVLRDREPSRFFFKNQGRGHLAIGGRGWFDYGFECEFIPMMATRSGIFIRYQGLRRYVALVRSATSLELIQVLDKEARLASVPCNWDVDGQSHILRLEAAGQSVSAYRDGLYLFSADIDPRLDCGGAGFLVEDGVAGFRTLRVD